MTGVQTCALPIFLKKWHSITGIPVLLNTSLNIKGQPILNDEFDVEEWKKFYKYDII